jgi:hypothetical protein
VDRVGVIEPTTSASMLSILQSSQLWMKESLFKSHPLHHLDVILGLAGLGQKNGIQLTTLTIPTMF